MIGDCTAAFVKELYSAERDSTSLKGDLISVVSYQDNDSRNILPILLRGQCMIISSNTER